ncbi:MAG: tetratricopeptide repeat protein [Candidatus Omnitrophota bacterium]
MNNVRSIKRILPLQRTADCFSRGKVYLLLFITAIVYSFSLPGDFVYDDVAITVVENPALTGEASLEEILSWDRPLREFTYMLDHALWGLHSAGYHLQNLLWHGANVLLLYYFLLLLGVNSRLAYAAALLFSIHPINVEAAAWISGRKELLCLFFELQSCFLFVHAAFRREDSQTSWWIIYGGSILACLCALLSKQVAVSIPVLLAASYWAYAVASHEPFRLGRFLRLIFPHALLTILFLFFSYGILETIGLAQERGVFYDPASRDVTYTLLSACLTPFATFFESLRLCLWPMDLTVERAYPPVTIGSDARWMAGAALMAGWFFIAIRVRKTVPYALFSLIWIFAAWAPVSGALPVGYLMADRYLYIPCAGFCLIFVILGERFLRYFQQRTVWLPAFCLFAIVLFFSAWTIYREFDWRNEIALWESASAARPNLAKARVCLGNAYADAGRREEAFQSWKKALELDPHLPQVWLNWGNEEKRAQRFSEAEACYNKALELLPTYGTAHYQLGLLYDLQGKQNDALEHFKLAAQHFYTRRAVNSRIGRAYYQISRIHFSRKEIQEARAYLVRAEKMAPEFAPVHLLKGMMSQNNKTARQAFQQAIRLNPSYSEAYYNLGALEWSEGRLELAQKLWERAIAINPSLSSLVEKIKGAQLTE